MFKPRSQFLNSSQRFAFFWLWLYEDAAVVTTYLREEVFVGALLSSAFRIFCITAVCNTNASHRKGEKREGKSLQHQAAQIIIGNQMGESCANRERIDFDDAARRFGRFKRQFAEHLFQQCV